MELTINNIPYTWELSGSNGASFVLYPTLNHTKNDIKQAKAWLRANRDVVNIHVANEDDLDELYRTNVFRHPYCIPLQWFQINADDMALIRKCRNEGMTIDKYVNTYVKGNENKTTESNKLKFAYRGDITKS